MDILLAALSNNDGAADIRYGSYCCCCRCWACLDAGWMQTGWAPASDARKFYILRRIRVTFYCDFRLKFDMTVSMYFQKNMQEHSLAPHYDMLDKRQLYCFLGNYSTMIIKYSYYTCSDSVSCYSIRNITNISRGKCYIHEWRVRMRCVYVWSHWVTT